MGLFKCPYEDTDLRCEYFRCICKGSKNCSYIAETWWLQNKIGKLTAVDKLLNKETI